MAYRYVLPPEDQLDWLSTVLAGGGGTVSSLVPASTTAVLRLRHPAYRGDAVGEPVRLRWAEAVPDRVVTTDSQFSDLVDDLDYENGPGVPGAVWDAGPTRGAVPPELAVGLAAALPPSTPWRFGVWAGWASVSPHADPSSLVHGRDRSYYLLAGTADDLATSLSPTDWRTPNLWWDEGLTWFVHTEVDRSDTFIAGSRELVDQLLLDLADYECTEVAPEDRLFPVAGT